MRLPHSKVGKRGPRLSNCSLSGQGWISHEETDRSSGGDGELNVYNLDHSNLLVFQSLLHVGKFTIAVNALVDSGVSGNFIAPRVVDQLRRYNEDGGRIEEGDEGIMTIRTAGGPSTVAPRKWVEVSFGCQTYREKLRFLIFEGVEATRYDRVLGKPWHATLNRRYSIHHLRNIMTIWDQRG